MRATLFDFDGVIADTESLHFAGFARIVAAQWGDTLSRAQYDQDWIGFDDYAGFEAIARHCGRELSTAQRDQLVIEKSVWLATQLDSAPLIPSALDSFNRAAQLGPVVIVSGALRSEIEPILDANGLQPAFIVAAGETPRGKPEPDPYIAAWQRLRRQVDGMQTLQPHECIVVEDTETGAWAGIRAGCSVYRLCDESAGDQSQQPWHTVRSHIELPWFA